MANPTQLAFLAADLDVSQNNCYFIVNRRSGLALVGWDASVAVSLLPVDAVLGSHAPPHTAHGLGTPGVVPFWKLVACPHSPDEKAVYVNNSPPSSQINSHRGRVLDTHGHDIAVFPAEERDTEVLVDANTGPLAGNLRWDVRPCPHEQGTFFIVNRRHQTFLQANSTPGDVTVWNAGGQPVDALIRGNTSPLAGNIRWFFVDARKGHALRTAIAMASCLAVEAAGTPWQERLDPQSSPLSATSRGTPSRRGPMVGADGASPRSPFVGTRSDGGPSPRSSVASAASGGASVSGASPRRVDGGANVSVARVIVPPCDVTGEVTLRILHLSDTHSMHDMLTNMPHADIVIHTGDFTNDGLHADVANFNDWLGHLKHNCGYKHVIVIPGNHDYWGPATEAVKGNLSKQDLLAPSFMKAQLTNATVLVHEEIEIQGLRIFGSSWDAWQNAADPDTRSLSFQPVWEASGRGSTSAPAHSFDAIPTGTHILLTHGPAYGILDCVGQGNKWAPNALWGSSRRLREEIIRSNAQVHLFGHVHEQRGAWVKQPDGTYAGGVQYTTGGGTTPFPTGPPPPPEYPCQLICNTAMANHPDLEGTPNKHFLAGKPRVIVARRAADSAEWAFSLAEPVVWQHQGPSQPVGKPIVA